MKQALRRRYGRSNYGPFSAEANAVASARRFADRTGEVAFVVGARGDYEVTTTRPELPYIKVHVDGRAVRHTASGYAHGRGR
jgi:hypothetical protein